MQLRDTCRNHGLKQLQASLPPRANAGSRRNHLHKQLALFASNRLSTRRFNSKYLAITLAVGLSAISTNLSAAPLSPGNFAMLARRCAPMVPVGTLEAVATTESSLNPWALHDNTTGVSDNPEKLSIANAEAARWLRHGDSVDIGLMQINSANLVTLGMTATTALDPCTSMKGGAAVLQAAYGGGKTNAEQQAALLLALSRYNTGSPIAGIMNGYVRKVMNNAEAETLSLPISVGQPATLVGPDAPPLWDISAQGVYTQTHGASWLIDFGSIPSVGRAPAQAPRPAASRHQLAST